MEFKKNILRTTLITIGIFLVIVFLLLANKTFNKKICTAQNTSCPENYTCDLYDNICMQEEKCPEKIPEFCLTLYDPVCSNGVEYSNSCVACSKGSKHYYNGKC